MVRKAKEMEQEIRERMRGGKGEVRITHIFKQDELKGKARLVAEITLESGCSIGKHEHAGEEEIFYIIEGEGIVDDNGDMRQVTAGDAILTGGGGYHAIENTGTGLLKMMAIILVY